ncbi:MAG TPA: SEC-C metal-binding domain-containing protein [Gemmatimonadaceae bacterium]|nr:SEC-C metal-binding domain-containing protein [Gemmatimonadaceae bacterium]
MNTAQRNDPCPCGSGKKYKRCCMAADEKRERTLRLVHPDENVSQPRSDLRDLDIGTVWQIDLAPIPTRFTDDPSARAAILIVFANDVALHADISFHAPSEYDDIAKLFEAAIDASVEASHVQPTTVEVRFSEIASPLARRLEPRGIPVRIVDRMPRVQAAMIDMQRRVLGLDLSRESDPSLGLRMSSAGTWRGWGLPDDRIARLFSAAAAFYRAAPWSTVSAYTVFRCERPGGGSWDCVVLGDAGMELGLGLYSRREDLARDIVGDASESELPAAGGAALSLTFDDADSLGRAAVREIRSAGWEVAASDAYPVLLSIDTPGGGVTSSQFQDLEAVLVTIPAAVRQNHDVLTGEMEGSFPLVWTDPESGTIVSVDEIELEDPGDIGEALWGIPSELEPSLPQGSGADPTATILDSVARDDSDRDEDALEAAEDREMLIVDRFGDQLSAGFHGKPLSDATVMKHTRNVSAFVDFLCRYQGIPLRAATEYDLRVFLYDWFPRKMVVSATDARSLPGSLKRFFSYLAAFEGIEYPWAYSILRDVDAFMERWESFPGGHWWDDEVGEWRSYLYANLAARGFLHDMGRGPEGGVRWAAIDGMMGPVEAELDAALQRLWLIWREEEIRRGTRKPEAVEAALAPRQHEWESTPNVITDGATPAEAIAREQATRPMPPH